MARQPFRKNQVKLYLSADAHRALRNIARARGKSMSEYMEELLRRDLSMPDAPPAPPPRARRWKQPLTRRATVPAEEGYEYELGPDD